MKKWVLTLGMGLLSVMSFAATDTWPQAQKLTVTDGVAGDWFGYNISIGDDLAIVGAYRDNDMGVLSGSAYIFERDGTTWSQTAKLTASDGAAGDCFGIAVSTDNDRVIVGAYGKNSSVGAAYVFYYNGTTWVQQAKLLASDGASSDYFGRSVSISGNYAIVGAYGDDDNGTSSGSVYIFYYNETAWSQQAKLVASDGAASDYFGRSVSISGDSAVISAQGDDDNGSASGSVYIFSRGGTTWTKEAKLMASDGTTGDDFGASVCISGDDVIVGADDVTSNTGSAYIFNRDGTTWTQQAKLTASDGATNDYFGVSVGISGDYAIVGAYFDADNGNYSGSAYVYNYSETTWVQQVKLTASDGAASDYFGYSVSIIASSSSYWAIAGAYMDDDMGSASGSAYLYQLCPRADMNDDCVVDLADVAVVAQWWLYGAEQ